MCVGSGEGGGWLEKRCLGKREGLGFEDSGRLPLVVVFDDLLSSECTHAIMSDALKRKQLWMKKLEDLKVEGLLALRDVVLATNIEHMAGVDDCKMNLDQIKTSVRHCCNVSSMMSLCPNKTIMFHSR